MPSLKSLKDLIPSKSPKITKVRARTRTFSKAIIGLGVLTLSACGYPSDAELVKHFQSHRNVYEAARKFLEDKWEECRTREGEYASLEIHVTGIKTRAPNDFSYDARTGGTCDDMLSKDDVRRLVALTVGLDQNFLLIEKDVREFSFLRYSDVPAGTKIYFVHTSESLRDRVGSTEEVFAALSREQPFATGNRPLSDGWYIRVRAA
jgi:hypothetical protein